MRFGNNFVGGDDDDYPPSSTIILIIINNNHYSTLRTLVGFYLLCIVLEPNFFAVAGYKEIRFDADKSDPDNDDGQFEILLGHDPLVNGSISTAGNDEGGRYEVCGTDLSFLGPVYGNISPSKMVCSPVWNTFVLRYYQRADNVMTIILSAVYTSGWIGIGFSSNGMMSGSSAMVGWFNKKGKGKIKQYYLQGTRESQVIPDKGELPLDDVPPVVALHGAMIYIAFQAKFDYRLGRQPLILAFGSRYPTQYYLTKHDDKTAIWFDFSQASVLDINHSQKKKHGLLGIIAWGLILPVGAIIARYLKHKDPLWYYLHAGIQFLGFTLGIATVLLGVQLYRSMDACIRVHRDIGIFVLVFSILQIMAFFLRPNKDSKYRRYWNWYHHWFGRITLFFGASNVLLGIQLAGAENEWQIGYGFLLSVTLVAVIVLEAYSCIRRRDNSKLPPTHQISSV
ncbi:hypothetical protein PTKIN_Ptkin15bG0054600 [Pterospermum kingtungense]